MHHRSMNQQPKSRTCFACGMENEAGLRLCFLDSGGDEVVAAFTLSAKHEGNHRIAHGGIVAALLDEVAGQPMMIGGAKPLFIGAKMEICFCRAVSVGWPLQAADRLSRQKGHLAFPHAGFRSSQQTVLEEADLFFGLPPATLGPPGAAEKVGSGIDQHQGEPAA
jgi:acyl-coenzyme A thioesterase PaaI-like protein